MYFRLFAPFKGQLQNHLKRWCGCVQMRFYLGYHVFISGLLLQFPWRSFGYSCCWQNTYFQLTGILHWPWITGTPNFREHHKYKFGIILKTVQFQFLLVQIELMKYLIVKIKYTDSTRKMVDSSTITHESSQLAEMQKRGDGLSSVGVITKRGNQGGG